MLDRQLLERYIQSQDQQAFAELVRRHLALVHAAARRQAPQAADDITQAVFLLLARKASSLPPHRPLAGWLCQTTRYCCANFNKREARRQHHEHEAAAMAHPCTRTPTPAPSKSLDHLLLLLDESLAKLSTSERDAVALRYLEGKSLEETGAELSISADAAAKRALRGLEKLRACFARQGYLVPASALATLLTTESAKVAPAALAAQVVVMGVQGAAVSAQTAAIAQGTLTLMAWAKAPLVAAVIVAGVLLGGAGVVVIPQILATSPPSPVVAPLPVPVAQPPIPAPRPPTQVAAVLPPTTLPSTFPTTAPAPMPAVADLSPQQRRIYEVIYEMRYSIPPDFPNEWIASLREVTSIGKPAVPALVAELDWAKRDGEQRLLIMALRIIRDPRAVPALIRAIPRVAQRSNEYILDNLDPDLKKFLNDHDLIPPKPPHRDCRFSTGISECIAALEAITGHSEGHDPIINSASKDEPDELARDLEQREEFAQRWQRWWDAHASGLLTRQDLESLAAARFDGDLVQAVGVAKHGAIFPTGPQVRLSPVHEVILDGQGFWDSKTRIDFDTGRVYAPGEGLAFPYEMKNSYNTWMRDAGIDAAGIRLGELDDLHCRLDSWDMKTWPIANKRFDTIEDEVHETSKALDLDQWGPLGSLVPRDLQTGRFRYREYPATFLFVTREGGRGIVQILGSVDEGRAVKIRYRMFEGLPVRRPPLADKLAAATVPAELRVEFGPAREVKLTHPTAAKGNSALALKSGAVRTQTVDVNDSAFTKAKQQWLREWSGDLLTLMDSEHKLRGLGGDISQAMKVSPAAWDKLRADEIPVFLARQFDPSSYPGGYERLLILYSYEKAPATWIFRTQRGDIGILQILALGEESLTLRYKLIKGLPSATAPATQPAERAATEPPGPP